MKKTILINMAMLVFFSTSLHAQDTTLIDSSSIRSQTNLAEAPPVYNSRQSVYRIKNGIDIPLTVAGDGWSLYGMSVIYNRDSIPASEILALRREDINSLDRPVSHNYSEKAAKISDYFFYGSMPLPLILMADKRIRKDAPKIGLLYLEAVGITGGIYVTSAMIAKRHRPYSYNSEAPMSKRTRGGVYNSFFAGHVAVVATSFFYTAQVYADYHPEMRHKWILYAGAGVVSTFTGAMRIVAGQHFYTDVATGLFIGTLSGLLTPYFHKRRGAGNARLTILPNIHEGSSGITLLYKLDKKRAG